MSSILFKSWRDYKDSILGSMTYDELEDLLCLKILMEGICLEPEPELSATAVPAGENGLEKSSELAGWAVVDDGGEDGLL